MSFEPFLIFLLIRQLRRTLQDTPVFAKWKKVLDWTLYATIFFFVAESALSLHHVIIWVWYLMLLGILYVGLTRDELEPTRTIMMAILPFCIISVLHDALKIFHGSSANTIRNYLHYAYPFAFIYMGAIWIISVRQKKSLQKERGAKEKEMERNRLIAHQKEELESLVAERTVELTQQKEELQQALVELKETQSQLIQREKMASLGELTAGIAHEIQNPLNFINNFSEVSIEMAEELEKEIAGGNQKQVVAIAEDIKQNLQKVVNHGKRADSIVKGMLQHSRSNTGQKEPTDINALVDEYMRLSYHGLRAKDKSFNATLQTEYDNLLEKVNIIPQDVGRVLLNLFNNAFYSMSEKKKKQEGDYTPVLFVSTNRINNGVQVCVRDNGLGIPKVIMDKIYNPFFTTKPTGEGTGLGLSLSYDIITKGHGGKIDVKTEEGQYAEFIIELPGLSPVI